MERRGLQNFLNFNLHQGVVDYDTIETQSCSGYTRHLIRYLGSEQDEIKAYLFIPQHSPIIGSILVHHQHNSERHLGKSEVAGVTGDPLQFFCPELVKHGIVCLAPDSISFEDRRTNKDGFKPDDDPDDDVLQHYNEMCYRLLRGTTLMKKVIEDSSIGISLLAQLKSSIATNMGVLGHSYGGNTVIFHSPFDDRIQYSCSSGAVCSYRNKFKLGTGIEMAEVIPGFAEKYDIDDLLKLVCPRNFLILSASADKFSQDAHDMYLATQPIYAKAGKPQAIEHQHYIGEHGLDQKRFDAIIKWFVEKYRENL